MFNCSNYICSRVSGCLKGSLNLFVNKRSPWCTCASPPSHPTPHPRLGLRSTPAHAGSASPPGRMLTLLWPPCPFPLSIPASITHRPKTQHLGESPRYPLQCAVLPALPTLASLPQEEAIRTPSVLCVLQLLSCGPK